MRPFFALIRKDLKGYFDQPTGYILLVIFTGVIAYLFFFVTPFNTTSEASLRDMFSLLPWLLAVFVPAATMRLLAEEQRDGTLEILLTQPIQGLVVLLTKFLSGLIFVYLAILATLGVPILLETAGTLDKGATVAQYVGAFFLAASFVSIGLFTSSLTRNQIVAFILGLFFNMGLLIVGLEVVAISLPVRVSGLLESLSPVTHFSSMARGVIMLRDILYFVALVSTFLSASFLMIRSKTLSHQSPQYRNLQLGVTGLIVLSLLVGWFGNSIGGRVDLTEDKVFTLSDGTAQIVRNLDDLLTIELYQSDDPPPQVSLVARDVRDFLEDFAASSDGKVKLVHRHPDRDEDDARKAQLAGVPPRQFNLVSQGQVQIKQAYLGITMTYADRREVIPFIASMDGFEYRLATLSYKMVQTDEDRGTVAFLTGHGEKSINGQLSTFASLLQEQYNVREVAATADAPPDLAGIDVLVVAGPTLRVPDSVKAALHDYLRRGGKVMVLNDPVLVDQQRFAAGPNQGNLADFVARYGVVVENNIVFDVRSHETLPFSTRLGSVLLPYPYWARVPTVDRKVAGQVESVLMPWASSLGITESEAGRIEVIPLMATTRFGAVDYSLTDLSPNSPEFNVTDGQMFNVDIGFAIEGPSESGGESFRLVVVGDSDWLTDPLVNRSVENLFMGLNLVDWLAQDETLASIRSKVVSTRTLVFDSAGHRASVHYANIIGIPLVFVVIGIVRFIRRRSITMRVYRREE